MSAIPIIGGALSALGGLFGIKSGSDANKTNLQIARETNQANAELAKYNWDQQKEMWNAQNAYNTPEAQMSRYRDAGLNPNLIYGQGSNGNSTSIPTPATPTMHAAHVDRIPYEQIMGRVGNDLVDYYNFALDRQIKENQSSLIESQAASNRAEVNVKNAQVAKLGKETARTQQEYDQSEELFKFTRKAADLEVKKGIADLEKKYNDIEMFPLQRVKMATEIRLLESGIVKNTSQAKLFAQEILESAQRIAKLAVDKEYTREQIVSLRRQGYGYLLDNSFKQATFDERVKMISEDLLSRSTQNNWHSAFGYSKDALSGVFGSSIWGVANALGGPKR